MAIGNEDLATVAADQIDWDEQLAQWRASDAMEELVPGGAADAMLNKAAGLGREGYGLTGDARLGGPAFAGMSPAKRVRAHLVIGAGALRWNVLEDIGRQGGNSSQDF